MAFSILERRFLVQLLVQSRSEEGNVTCNERYMVDDILWERDRSMVRNMDTDMGWLSELATGKGSCNDSGSAS